MAYDAAPAAVRARPGNIRDGLALKRGLVSVGEMASTGNYFTRIYERAADMVNQVRHVSSDETRPLLHGQGQRSYQGTEDDSIPVPKPRPVVTPVKVEAKVWFANERTWISWLRASLLLGTLALALFN